MHVAQTQSCCPECDARVETDPKHGERVCPECGTVVDDHAVDHGPECGQNDETLDDATQQAAIVDALRAVAPTAEMSDVTIVVEPLNTRVDHPGYFLPTTDAGVAVVDAVDSQHVKLLFDIYHQQITDGDVIRRLGRQIEHIGHIHVADNPGRHEPGTGELDYERIFTAIAALDYDGYVSGEFTPEGDPDEAAQTFVELADTVRR